MTSQTKYQQQKSIKQLTEQLRELACNFWWTWNSSAQMLFASIDPALWEATERNPLLTIKLVPDYRLLSLASDATFLANLKAVQKQFAAYMKSKTWFDRTAKGKDKKAKIAYFCAEFAIHESFPIYSGLMKALQCTNPEINIRVNRIFYQYWFFVPFHMIS